MSETLSKQKVIDLIKKTKDEVAESETAIADFAYIMLENLKQTEIADAAPVVHGHWNNVGCLLNIKFGYCSNCGIIHEVTQYCPYCGAKMDEEEQHEEKTNA